MCIFLVIAAHISRALKTVKPHIPMTSNQYNVSIPQWYMHVCEMNTIDTANQYRESEMLLNCLLYISSLNIPKILSLE